MRGPNKMPSGYYPNKRGLKQQYLCHVSADISWDDNDWINEFAKTHYITRAEVIRRCIRGAKLTIDILKAKDEK